jgi:hypothetical protein
MKPTIYKLFSEMNSITTKYKYGLSLSLLIIAFVLAYLTIYRKLIYFTSSYNVFDLLFFLGLIFLMITFAAFLFLPTNFWRSQFQIVSNACVAGTVFIIALSLLNSTNDRTSQPVEIYDRDIFQFVEKLGDDISLCGYPEMMDNIHALVPNRVKVNLGQERSHVDAIKFYHLLNAYYSENIENVYRYMDMNDYDYFVIQKDYFHSKFTEGNSLFSFYPMIIDYEDKLRRKETSSYVLLDPPNEIIEFESQKSIVISFQKLKSYLQFL